MTPVFVTGAVQKRRLLELAAAASREWRADPAKLAELKRWTRFDDASALSTRDGLAPGPAGRPALPPVVGGALFDLLAASDRQNDRLVTRGALVGWTAGLRDGGGRPGALGGDRASASSASPCCRRRSASGTTG